MNFQNGKLWDWSPLGPTSPCSPGSLPRGLPEPQALLCHLPSHLLSHLPSQSSQFTSPHPPSRPSRQNRLSRPHPPTPCVTPRLFCTLPCPPTPQTSPVCPAAAQTAASPRFFLTAPQCSDQASPRQSPPPAAPPYPRVAAHIEPQQRAGRRGEQAPQEPGGQEADAALGRVEAGVIGEVAVGSSAGLQGGNPPADGRRHFVVRRARAPGGAETFRGKMVPRGRRMRLAPGCVLGEKRVIRDFFV